jgi:pilus assembly protein TadC
VTVAVCALATVAACCAWPQPPTSQRRLRALFPAGPASRGSAGVRRPVLVAAGVAVAAAVAAGGSPWLLAVVAAAAIAQRARRRTGADRMTELPLVVDLLASCLAAGAATPAALGAAAAGAEPRLRRRIVDVQDQLSRGVAPRAAWASWLDEPELAPVARTCLRGSTSGAAVAAELERVATRLRAARAAEVDRRLARASVWVVLPLGLCFLPAFVLVGVVPVALGLLGAAR